MEATQVSINRQVDKEDVGHTHRYRHIHTHNGILAIKKNEILPFTTTWMDLENMAMKLSQKRQILYHLSVDSKK